MFHIALERNPLDFFEEQASDASVSESVSKLQQRVFVKEEQENNRLLEQLRQFLNFERHTVRTQICELQAISTIVKKESAYTETDGQPDNIQQLKTRISELEAELELVHQTYRKKLDEQSHRASEKNAFFMQLLDQLHLKHSEQLEYYRVMIAEYEEERKHIGSIELKMNQIGHGIEDILKESSELTKRNEELEEKLQQEQHNFIQMKKQLDKYKEITSEHQAKTDEYEKMRLRGIKFQRDLTQMLDQTDTKLAQIPTKDKSEKTSTCSVSGQPTIQCPHCRLARIQDKYSVAKH